jgi:hypothetical protein
MSNRWPLEHDLYLFLELVNSDGTGKTGETPQVAIKKVTDIDGTPIPNQRYWSNSGSLTGAVTFNDMSEEDSANLPGLYSYIFSQSLLGQQDAVYMAYFSSSLGFTTEKHYFSVTGSLAELSATFRFYESED